MWNMNIWITTSGLFTVRQFGQLRQVNPIERIIYLVDYSFASTTTGCEFVSNLLQAQIFSENEMDSFAYKNTEAL